MRLGYDLTIEQSQKLIMTPELIQAIQILQFNTQELETYVEEQLLANPILEIPTIAGSENDDLSQNKQLESEKSAEDYRSKSDNEFDWAEHFKEKEYDDISYKQWEYKSDKKEYSYEQYVTSEITLVEHLMFQLQFAPIKPSCRHVGRYIIEQGHDLQVHAHPHVLKDYIEKNYKRKISGEQEKLCDFLIVKL